MIRAGPVPTDVASATTALGKLGKASNPMGQQATVPTLAKEGAQRYQTGCDLAEALQALVSGLSYMDLI